MAFAGAGGKWLSLIMRLMAGIAAGNVTVGCVAVLALQLSMGAGEFLKRFERLAVAGAA